MCQITNVNFVRNGSNYIPGCTATTNDTMGMEAIVNFTEAPINVYTYFTVNTPTGQKSYYANNGNYTTIVNNGTYTIVLTSNDGFSMSDIGTYTLVDVVISNDTKTSALCGSSSSTNRNCTSVGITAPSQQYTIQITSGTGGQTQVFINGNDTGYFYNGTKTFTVNNGDNISVWCDANSGYTFTNLCINNTTTCTTARPFNFTANMNLQMTATFTSTPSCTNPKYKCSGTSCISDNCDGSGTYTTTNCNNACTGGCGVCSKTCLTGTCSTAGEKCLEGVCWACDPVMCPNDGKHYCISGTCVPQNYLLYAIVGVGALLLLSRR